jgi:aldehyde:ferredoxin oxidoreductase
VICPYAAFAMGEVELAAMLSAATGNAYTGEDLLRAGERIYNQERMFNIRAGFSRKDDTLPERFFGGDGIDRELFRNILTEYYHLRGWDERGVPSQEKLQELGLWEG